MKKAKVLIIALVVIVVVAIGAGVALLLSLNSIVKAGVEQAGPVLTGVPIKVESVNISLLSGSGELTGIVVGNPEGFKTPSAFELDRVRIKLQPMSVFSDTIVVNEVLIDGPRTTYEMANGTSNIATIQKNIESKVPAGSGEETPEEKPKEEETSGGKKLIIEDLQINNTKLGVSAGFLGGKQMNMDMPDIHLTDIGKDSGGATPAEVLNEIFKKLTDVISGVTDSAGDMLKSGGDSIKDAAGSAVKSIKGIFGGSKDE